MAQCKCCPVAQADPIEYPKLDPATWETVKIIAKGLCISTYSLSWAVKENTDGRWRAMRHKLLSPNVKVLLLERGGDGAVKTE